MAIGYSVDGPVDVPVADHVGLEANRGAAMFVAEVEDLVLLLCLFVHALLSVGHVMEDEDLRKSWPLQLREIEVKVGSTSQGLTRATSI